MGTSKGFPYEIKGYLRDTLVIIEYTLMLQNTKNDLNSNGKINLVYKAQTIEYRVVNITDKIFNNLSLLSL